MRVINLPTDLLRAFISVIDLGGYTRAANALGRTQPAISLQMKRLEELLDATLITHEGRGLKLTEEGEALAVYARQLLRLNDEAVAKLKGRSAKGLLRIGLPTDFSVAFLQEAMLDFARDQPDVTMSIHCDLSRNVLDWLHADELDIAVALLAREANPYLVRSWEEKPIWAAARDLAVHKQQPVPLVTHPEGCEYRRRMTAALRAAGRDWRVAYTNPGDQRLAERRRLWPRRHRAHPQDASAQHARPHRARWLSGAGTHSHWPVLQAPAPDGSGPHAGRFPDFPHGPGGSARPQGSRRSISGHHAFIRSINFPHDRSGSSFSTASLDFGAKT